MTALVFMDTETTGLALDDDIWEFAAIRREPDGSETALHLFIEHDREKCSRLPESFRRDHVTRWPVFSGEGKTVAQKDAAAQIAALFHDRPHVVGAVPNFDTERLALFLGRHGQKPGWHYHLIDVENLAVGYLAARGTQIDLPWDSDALSLAVGVTPPAGGRHTAMGDAEWARAMYDHILANVDGAA